MIKQKFLKESYDKYDAYAKDLMVGFLEARGHEIIKDKEDYNHDLVTKKNGETLYFELEVKINYPFTSRATYPFTTVSFLGRKERLHLIKPFFYIILCYETGVFVSCHSTDIYKEKYRETINITSEERRGDDIVYRVPKSKCMFSKIRKVNMENRKTGRSTREIDDAVQDLFNTGDCNINDHHGTRLASAHTFKKLCFRLLEEHAHMKDKFLMDKDKFTIKIKDHYKVKNS